MRRLEVLGSQLCPVTVGPLNVASSSNEEVRLRIEGNVAIVTVDHPPVNALSAKVLSQLLAKMQSVQEQTNVHAVVLCGHGGTFIAGADIKEMGKQGAQQEVLDWSALEDSAKPVVAAIDRFALGGGLELAMLCSERVTHEDAKLGLPELTLGIIPGFGGTQRLPRLVGVEKALTMMLTSEPVSGREALSLGLVDAVCKDAKDVLELAVSRARALGKSRRVIDRNEKIDPSLVAVVDMAEAMTRKQLGRANVVHPYACIEAVRACVLHPLEPLLGLQAEQQQFARCVVHPAFPALRSFFLAQRACAKEVYATGSKPRPIRKVVIVGAGKMGSGIAAVLARVGVLVLMLDVSDAMLQTCQSYIKEQAASKKRPFDASLVRFTSRYQDVERDVDLALEAVSEQLAVKRKVFATLLTVVGPDCIIATNTSSIDLAQIAQDFSASDRARFCGFHWFNPPVVSRLVEIVRLPDVTSLPSLAALATLTRRVDKIPIVVS